MCSSDLKFYESPEYTHARGLRKDAAVDMQLMVIEGFEEPPA